MVDFSAWASADPLTVEQAACLWVNLDPSYSRVLGPQEESAAIAPRLQMLAGAIVSGELKADTSTNVFAMIGDHGNSLVTRADLIALAKSRGERPAFLFDTMLVSASTEPKSVERTSASNVEPRRRNKGGRPPEYDWNAFTLEIIRIANTPDGLPDTRAELVRIMLDWFAKTFDQQPSESNVEARISKVYQYLEQSPKT